jgi:hypothetical protein
MTSAACKRFKRLRYWCQDETRFGLKTIQRRRLTLKGIKPVGKMQWQYKTFYLYGVVEPKTGESFFERVLPSGHDLLREIPRTVFSGLSRRFTHYPGG